MNLRSQLISPHGVARMQRLRLRTGIQSIPNTRRWSLCGMASLIGIAIGMPTARAQVPVQFAKYSRAPTAVTLNLQGPHTGVVRDYGKFHVETVVRDSGIQIYLSPSSGQGIPNAASRGVALLKLEGDSKRFRFDLLPNGDNLLEANANLSRIHGKQIELDILLVSLPNELVPQGSLRYRDVITIPPSPGQLAASAIARQGVCPVSGKRLGSMGTPIPVSIGDNTIYACCSSCVQTIEGDPLKYATGKPTILVSAATAEDAAGIAWQKVCPVMDEPLGGMGQPIKVLVGGKPIYLCCRGCIKKIEAKPRKYLDMVYGPAQTNPASTPAIPSLDVILPESTRGSTAKVGLTEPQLRPGIFHVSDEDTPHIAAQKRCPVMDEPLDAMGGPYKVNAGGRAIYICCPGCAKRIAADPAKYVNILASQGVEAPMVR